MVRNIVLSRRIYKTAYLAFLLVAIIPFVNSLLITKLLIALFTAWGVGLVVYDLAKNKLSSYKKRAFIPILAFFVLCMISYVVNHQNGVVKNTINLGIFFIFASVFYITASDDRETLKKEVVSVFKAYTVGTGLMAIVCIVMYIAQFRTTYIGQQNISYRIGVWENRLFGLFSSSNVGGSIMAIGLIISAGLLIYLKKSGKLSLFWSITLIVSAFFEAWYISLSVSRGTQISLAAAAVAFFLLYGYRPSKNAFFAVAKRVACAGLAVLTFYGFMLSIRQISFKTVQFLDSKNIVEIKVDGFDRVEYKDEKDKEKQDSAEDKNDKLKPSNSKELTDIEKKLSSISNKRYDIWKSALNVSRDKRLFGCAKYYNEYALNGKNKPWLTEYDTEFMEWSKGNAHNGYLQIFVDIGIFGLLSYMVFLVWCLIKNIKAYKKASINQKTAFAVCLSIVCYVLVNNLFETNMVLMSSNVISATFWFVAGICMTLSAVILKREEEE